MWNYATDLTLACEGYRTGGKSSLISRGVLSKYNINLTGLNMVTFYLQRQDSCSRQAANRAPKHVYRGRKYGKCKCNYEIEVLH